MRRYIPVLASALFLLAGCGQADKSAMSDTSLASADTAESEMAEPEIAEANTSPRSGPAGAGNANSNDVPSADIKVSVPQIAYVYRYGFRVNAGEIAPLQSAHADLCETKGPQVCRIINLSQSGGEGDYANASLEMEIAAPQARSFGDTLTQLAEKQGGEPIDTSISGTDLSKQIVDTQARLRARIVLRDRLMEILRNRSGKVSELVEAERGVAEVNEEIDQAQSWLAEMKGRVSFSKMTVSYNAGSPSAGSFLEPIRHALGSAGSILGMTIAFMISAAIFLLPWAIIIGLVWWSRKRFGWRLRFWRHGKESGSDTPNG